MTDPIPELTAAHIPHPVRGARPGDLGALLRAELVMSAPPAPKVEVTLAKANEARFVVRLVTLWPAAPARPRLLAFRAPPAALRVGAPLPLPFPAIMVWPIIPTVASLALAALLSGHTAIAPAGPTACARASSTMTALPGLGAWPIHWLGAPPAGGWRLPGTQ